uniref:Uncharacterized protein n=1 Tax=Quercus lobata TaxID=97700 RepID=A0A7N2LEV2_QUELO
MFCEYLVRRPYLRDTRKNQLSPFVMTLHISVIYRAHASLHGKTFQRGDELVDYIPGVSTIRIAELPNFTYGNGRLVLPGVLEVPISKHIVEDWKIGWKFKKDVGVVTRGEISELVKKIMDNKSDAMNAMRQRAKELQKSSQRAIAKDPAHPRSTRWDAAMREGRRKPRVRAASCHVDFPTRADAVQIAPTRADSASTRVDSLRTGRIRVDLG